jgi:hypothetical protein
MSRRKSKPSNPSCAYCGKLAALVTGADLYPHRPDLHAKRFWACDPCGAWVGVHPGTVRPLGRLANAELRRAKMRAHAAFDPLWRDGLTDRRSAYSLLADELGISREACHVGYFDAPTCERVVVLAAIIRRKLEDGRSGSARVD